MFYTRASMALSHSFPSSYKRGFTIVELLIVIVIIGILAAITIVAYNGIQTKANNTATLSSVAAYAKTLQMYATENGTYPIDTSYPCLGPSGITCANVTSTTTVCYGAGQASYHAGFASAIHTIASTLPPPSTQQISCGGAYYVGAYYESSSDGKTAYITYFLQNTSDCGSPSGLDFSYSNTGGSGIECVANLPSL